MDSKKISFGFTKQAKKPNTILIPPVKKKEKVELVECLEGQSIKIKDHIEEIIQPLTIPLKEDQKNIIDRIKNIKKSTNVTSEEDNKSDAELTLDELAARELIKDAQNRLSNVNNSKDSGLIIKEDLESFNGSAEPTIKDYESVPVTEYGMAVLRGMGWKEGMAIGKNTSKIASVSVPELRPKGLGLGASKMLQTEIATKPVDKDGKELTICKGAYAKIIAGFQKGNYCEVQGFDDEVGRVIIKVYPKGNVININELLLVPVLKEEFVKFSKVLNNAKYEEFKEISDKKIEDFRNKNSDTDHDNKIQKNESKTHREDSSSSYSRRHKSNHESSSEDESRSYHKHHKKHKKKSKKHDNSSNSDEDRTNYRKSKKSSKSNDKKIREKTAKSKHKSRHRSSDSEEDRKYRK